MRATLEWREAPYLVFVEKPRPLLPQGEKGDCAFGTILPQPPADTSPLMARPGGGVESPDMGETTSPFPSLPGSSRQSTPPLALTLPWITGTSPVMTIEEAPCLPPAMSPRT